MNKWILLELLLLFLLSYICISRQYVTDYVSMEIKPIPIRSFAQLSTNNKYELRKEEVIPCTSMSSITVGLSIAIVVIWILVTTGGKTY